MRKYRLEDIKKNRVFTAPPEGYFDKLPGVIQSKTAHKASRSTKTYWIGVLRVLPAAAALVLIMFYAGVFETRETPSVEDLLAEVSNEEIIDYLSSIDLSTEEILEEVDINELSLDFQESQNLMESLELDDADLIDLYGEWDEVEPLL